MQLTARCDAWPMSVDMGALLDRVVADAFAENFVVESGLAHQQSIYSLLVRSVDRPGRSVEFSVGVHWVSAWIPELGVSTSPFEFGYRDNEVERARMLAWLCEAMASYLDGEGEITERKALILRRKENVLKLQVMDKEWILGVKRHLSPGPD